MKREKRDASGIKDAKLENCPEDFYPPEIVKFKAFHNDPIIARTTGRTASLIAIDLDDTVDSNKHRRLGMRRGRHWYQRDQQVS